MKTELHTDWTVGDIAAGFVFDPNEGRGLRRKRSYSLRGGIFRQGRRTPTTPP